MTKKEYKAFAELAVKAEKAAEELRDALQSYYDEKSERWQNGDKGDDWNAMIDETDNAYSSLQSIHETLEQM
jgi:hypothetical protein